MANGMVTGDINGDRICVNSGLNRALQTAPTGDDLGPRWGQIDPGPNGVLNSMIALDDVVIGTQIFPGNNAIVDTVPLGDDQLNDQVIWDGPDRTCNTAATADDGQVRMTGNVETATLTGFDDWRSNLKYDFTSLLNGFQITGTGVPGGRCLEAETGELMKNQATLADLSVTQTFTRSGEAVTITLTARNNGADPALLPTINDKVPTEITPLTCASSGGETCLKMGNHYAVNLQGLTVGQQKTVTITACSTAVVGATNTASVTSTSTDPNLANNESSVTLGANATWATGKNYAVGSRVTFQGMVFKCLQAHTSQSTWTRRRRPPCGTVPSPACCRPGRPRPTTRSTTR